MAKKSNPTSREECSAPDNICIDSEKVSGKNYAYEAKNYFESQQYAISGIRLIINNERNFRIQLVIVLYVILFGILFQISHSDWVALSVVMGLVLVSEAFNSVIEAMCDTISKDYKVNIRYAKDVSAGAVLVSAIISMITGTIIFFPYVWTWIESLAS